MGMVPCGGYLARLRSQRLDASVTPNKTKKNYYDDEPLKEMFNGMDRSERTEQYMEETKGLGAITHEDVHTNGGRAARAKEEAFLKASPEVEGVT